MLATLSNFQILPTCHRDDSDPGISEMVTPGVRHVTAVLATLSKFSDLVLVLQTTILILILGSQILVTPRCRM